jgi:two-component system, OmpR family, response regulator
MLDYVNSVFASSISPTRGHEIHSPHSATPRHDLTGRRRRIDLLYNHTINLMASEKLRISMRTVVATSRGGPPTRGETGGLETFGPSGQKVSDERSRPTCLVVEDDHTMRHLVMNYLQDHDIRAISAAGRDEVAALFARDEPSLVILDLRLGQEDGLDLLREIRSHSDVPVIITTGHRRDEIDRVVGLELGADDYITKPFGLRELLARIRAVLRRREAGQVAAQRDPERGRCRFGAWQLDRRSRRLSDSSGVIVALTKGEYALLIAFLDAPQRPLSREHLLQATRVHEDVFDRSIDVQVLRLRRKLETDPSAPSIIQTERGVGYLFALPVENL